MELFLFWGFFMKLLRFISLLLIIIGALNWGLWGFFQMDLVQIIFNSDTGFWPRAVYSIIGIAGIYGISFFFNPYVYGYSKAKHSGTSDKE